MGCRRVVLVQKEVLKKRGYGRGRRGGWEGWFCGC